MERVKIGVLGAGRGATMIKYCTHAENAELVAVCDKSEYFLNSVKKKIGEEGIAWYSDFDEFLQHDMDAVVLANYATEHVPFAIRCMEAGKHVISEVLPCQTMKEAVELVEAVEKYGKVYAYAENYCFMPAPREMRRLYREGKLGTFEYGEGEYFHNCEGIWAKITQGDPNHWRVNMTASYYCTHSIGPLLHITGLRPVRVTGFELPFNARMERMGAKAGLGGIEMIELENGTVVKSAHGIGISKNSIWFSVYGSKGRAESAREDIEAEDVQMLYTNLDEYEGENAKHIKAYKPQDELSEAASIYGHGGSDYYSMWNFVEKIKGNPDADIIDVYEALDMGFTGLFGYESVMKGGVPVEIPDFRKPENREKYRNDTRCTDPVKAGDMLIPSYSKGNPEIPQETYEGIVKAWEKYKEEEAAKEAQKSSDMDAKSPTNSIM